MILERLPLLLSDPPECLKLIWMKYRVSLVGCVSLFFSLLVAALRYCSGVKTAIC